MLLIKKHAISLLVMLAGLLFQHVAQAQLTPPALKVGCDWFLVFGPGGQGGSNTAFPEANSYYWIALISENVPAGSRLRMEGRYDTARYFSFEVHDGNLQVLDTLADYLIEPDSGSRNPFVGPADIDPGVEAGGAYTAYTRFGSPLPAKRDANKLYRPTPKLLDGTAKKRSALVYRAYLKTGPTDIGSLPKLTLELPDGSSSALADAPDAAACAALQRTYIRNGTAIPGSANLVDPTPPALLPEFRKYAGAALGLAPATGAVGTVGYNPNNGFLFVKTQQLLGDLLLVRARAPTYATESGAAAEANVRYWSLCQNGFDSQRVVACMADRDAVLDGSGFFTTVIGQDATRPPLAQAAAGFNWLPWSAENSGDVLLRYLLQDPAFGSGIQQVPPLGDPGATMGDYAPQATCCSRAVFSANAASGPERAFAACAASRSILARTYGP